MTDDRLDRIKRRLADVEVQLERNRRESDRAEAALEQVLAEIKQKFGVGSIEELERLHAEEIEQAAEKARIAESMLAALEKELARDKT